jgi:hypothetical protein
MNLLEIALRRIEYEGVHSVVVTADLASKSGGDTASVIVIVDVLAGCTTGHTNASGATSENASIVGNSSSVRLASTRLHIALKTVGLTQTGLLVHVVDAETSETDTTLVNAASISNAASDIGLSGSDRLSSHTGSSLAPATVCAATTRDSGPAIAEVLEHRRVTRGKANAAKSR